MAAQNPWQTIQQRKERLKTGGSKLPFLINETLPPLPPTRYHGLRPHPAWAGQALPAHDGQTHGYLILFEPKTSTEIPWESRIKWEETSFEYQGIKRKITIVEM
jgi:hypothetical protein